MIYEVTTYNMRPRTVPSAEAQLGGAYVARSKHSPLIGAFHTEFGPLNQIVLIWRYEDFAHRERVSTEVANEDSWPPVMRDVVLVNSEIMSPVSFSPALTGGKLGPYYELRRYTYPVGTLDKMMRCWERAMPIRAALGSPVAAIWTGEVGGLNSLIHLWPYRSLQEREEIRDKARETGRWPPYKNDEVEGGKGYEILSQENKLLLPAEFSPLQ